VVASHQPRINNERRRKMKNILLIAVTILVVGCTDTKGTTEALKDEGLTPVKVGGYGFFACSEEDFFATKFIATRANGRTVDGVVCKGIFKGKTIRFK